MQYTSIGNTLVNKSSNLVKHSPFNNYVYLFAFSNCEYIFLYSIIGHLSFYINIITHAVKNTPVLPMEILTNTNLVHKSIQKMAVNIYHKLISLPNNLSGGIII